MFSKEAVQEALAVMAGPPPRGVPCGPAAVEGGTAAVAAGALEAAAAVAVALAGEDSSHTR